MTVVLNSHMSHNFGLIEGVGYVICRRLSRAVCQGYVEQSGGYVI